MKHERIMVRESRPTTKERIEHGLEAVLFASRMLLVKFAQECWHIVTHTLVMTESDAVLAVLSLIDITLTGNLLLMVLFAGYENFVSKMDIGDHEDRPDWMGKVDFAGLKLKLVASIVAISGINLLKNFMALEPGHMNAAKEHQLFWMVIIHIVFIASGVMLAFMDRIAAGTGSPK